MENQNHKFKCEYCNKILSSKSSLNLHVKTAKYCIKIQEENKVKTKKCIFDCEYCLKNFSTKQNLNVHYKNCNKLKQDSIIEEKEKKLIMLQINLENFEKQKEEYKEQLEKQKEEYKEQLEKQKEEYKEQIKELQDKLERLANKAIQKHTNNLFEIEIDTDEEINSEYKLTPLEIENGLIIENRKEDGYIDITNLCKAGNKQFKHWKELEKSKAYLHALSSQVGIPTSDLIKLGSGSIHKNSHTWVHPQVAINIAQWISPYFDVKVSAWVYEIYLTGKVDISNTKTYQELKEENKNKELKITFLTNKYVKKQKRQNFENDNNVIYILTTEYLKKDRIYIFGKAKKLKNRISTYNKSEEHEVVYYKECKNEEIMSCVENMVFNKLSDYRQQANRERFFLPLNKEIDYFINIVDSSINFLSQ